MQSCVSSVAGGASRLENASGVNEFHVSQENIGLQRVLRLFSVLRIPSSSELHATSSECIEDRKREVECVG